nr:uncharacterized protein LOC113816938 [Penaeus vannamei]
MASGAPLYATVETFSPEGEPFQVGIRWKAWIESFEDYLAVLEVKDSQRKLQYLRYHMGVKTKQICKIFPNYTSLNTYEAMVSALNQHFVPKVNKFYERFKFSNCKPRHDEKIDSWVTRLKQAATLCEFPELEERIIETILLLTPDRKFRDKLLEEDPLTLDKLMEMARLREISKSQTDSNETKEFMSKGQERKGRLPASVQGNSSGESTPRHKPRARDQRYPSAQGCRRCGRENHRAKDTDRCPAMGKQCNNCKKWNHFAQVCTNKRNQRSRNVVYKTEDTQESDYDSDKDWVFSIV